MEALVIVGAIASVAQLVEIIHVLASSMLDFISRVREFPDEIRRLTLTLQSIRAKLEILGSVFLDPSNEPWLSQDICDSFKKSLTEVQVDMELFGDALKVYDSDSRAKFSLHKTLRNEMHYRKKIAKCMKQLESSEDNLQRLESSIQMYMMTQIYRNVGAQSILDNPKRLGHDHSHPTSHAVKSRSSLLYSESLLRKHKFYGWVVGEECKEQESSQTTISLGVCLPAWLLFPSFSLALNLITVSLKDGWSIRWGIHVQYRVPNTAPIMRACQEGDVALIRQILIEGRGGLNDRTTCIGRTPLLIAIRGEHFKAVRFLLEQGADPNIADDDQVTPLFAVAGMDPITHPNLEQLPSMWDRWLETFRLLLKYGASISETVRGRHLAGLSVENVGHSLTILDFLRLLAAEDFLQLSVVSGVQCWSALHNALRCASEATDALNVLYSSKVNLSNIMDDGRSALHLASANCVDTGALQYLLAVGCREHINRQDQCGWTPLHYATAARKSSEGHAPYLNAVTLLREGADSSLKGSANPIYIYDQPDDKFTAFELLSHVRPARSLLLLEVLEKAGFPGK